MNVLGINVKTASLEEGAPIHEIALLFFDTTTCCTSNQVQLFPRIPESDCDRIDIESLMYSGVDLEEVMHVNRPSLSRCLEFFRACITRILEPHKVVYLSHNTVFAFQQLHRGFERIGMPWDLPVPSFGVGAEPGAGYIDTSELIGLCDCKPKNRKLETLATHFRFNEVYTSEHLNPFLQSAYTLDNYFYQDQMWRKRSALLDLLKTCYVYQQIKSIHPAIPHPGYGNPAN